MKGTMSNPKLEALQKMQQAQYGEYLKGLQNYGAPNDAGVPALPGGTPQEEMTLEMGPPKIHPELELEIGPPKIQPEMELLFGKPKVTGRGFGG